MLRSIGNTVRGVCGVRPQEGKESYRGKGLRKGKKVLSLQ